MRPYGNCFTVAVLEFAGARNAPLQKFSGDMIEMARTPKGRPYRNCFTVAVLEFVGARNAPLQKFSVDMVEMARTPKGRPYKIFR